MRQIIRWIFVVPLSIGIYLFSKICLNWTFYYISRQMVEDINSVDDYGGHYILGSIFIFLREAFAIGFGVYSGVYLAPRNKMLIFSIYIFLWFSFLLFASLTIGYLYSRMEWTTEKLFRNLTEIIAQISGFVVAGIYIFKEQDENQDKTNAEQVN